jgi:hypothetical protein
MHSFEATHPILHSFLPKGNFNPRNICLNSPRHDFLRDSTSHSPCRLKSSEPHQSSSSCDLSAIRARHTHTQALAALADMHIPKRHHQSRKRGIRLSTNHTHACASHRARSSSRSHASLFSGPSALVDSNCTSIQRRSIHTSAPTFSSQACLVRYLLTRLPPHVC